MHEQIKDPALVLGYYPNLTYEKIITANRESTNKTQQVIDSSQYSNTLGCFLNNTPYQLLTSLQDSIQRIEAGIERLLGSYQDLDNLKKLGFYISNQFTTKEAIEFLKNAESDILSSSIPEVIALLLEAKEVASHMSQTIKKLYYGNTSLTDEEMNTITKAYNSVLKEKEANDATKINYLTLYCDASVNKVLTGFLNKLNAACLDLENSARKETTTTLNGDLSPIASLFDTALTNYKWAKQEIEIEQIKNTIDKTLYHYYNSRKQLMEYYSISYQSGDAYLRNKIETFESNLYASIENVAKSTLHYSSTLMKIKDIESEKQHLRSIYQKISYNA